MKPCLTCQTPTERSYCDEHAPKPWRHREGSARARGYSSAWDKLSRRARRLQPFCSDCGSQHDLQLDHTERTWQRYEQGKVVRLKDTGGVVCGPCNRARGAARGRPDDQGTGALEATNGPRAKAQSPSLSLGQDLGDRRSIVNVELEPSTWAHEERLAVVGLHAQDTVVEDLVATGDGGRLAVGPVDGESTHDGTLS